jgi:DUF4097 and DUF4098 domain-containing protein YvlB
MASYPPPPVPPIPPPGYDPRSQRRYLRDQARAQRAAFRAQMRQMRYQMRGMRRGSVLGPILLIAIGVVFLLIQSGRLDHDHFWGWYGHWWPLLLVGAGVVVMAEWALDQMAMRDPERPAYRRSLGGGVIFLLLLFVIAGISAGNGFSFHGTQSNWVFPGMHFDQDSLDELFGDKHESDQTLDVPFAAGGSLTVVNPRGDVTISGTSDDNRIHIALHKQIYSRTDSESDSRAQQFVPAMSNNGADVFVKMPALDGARGDLVITVPAVAATNVTANRGDIHIASIKAAVSTTANHGDIELSAITGAASAHINNSGSSITAHDVGGGIEIQGRAQDVTLADITGPVSVSGDIFGTTHLEHINGGIRFHTSRADFQLARLDGEAEIHRDAEISADQAMGPVVITTHNGNVTLDRAAGNVWVTETNGTIDLTAAPTLGSITLEDRNGSIQVTLPENAGYTIQAATTNGDIESDLQLAAGGTENDKMLSGTVGAGGPLVHITTTNGDVSVHKGEVQPLSPTPPAPPKITLVPPTPPPAPHAAKHKAAE